MGLSLPTIQRRSISPLARQDVNAPVRAANAASAAAHAAGQTAAAVANVVRTYADRVMQDNIKKANLSVHKADMAFQRTYGGKEEFRLGEIDDENFLEVANQLGYEDEDAIVPAHQVYAAWRNKNYKEAVHAASPNISDAKAKEAFLQEQDIKNSETFTQESMRATKAQIAYTAKKDMAEMEEFLLKKDFEGARLLIDKSKMGSDLRENAYKDIDKREQTTYIVDTIAGKNLAAMEKAWNELNNDDPKVMSRLTATEQKVYQNELWRLIQSANTSNKSGADASLKILAGDLKDQIEDSWNLKTVDTAGMLERTKQLANSGKHPELVREALWTLQDRGKVQTLLQSPENIQKQIFAEWEKNYKGDDMQKRYALRQYEKLKAESDVKKHTDAMQWAIDVGFRTYIPLNTSSPATLVDSLRENIKSAVAIKDTHNAFTGILPQNELKTLGTWIENSKDKKQALKAINQGAGKYSGSLYEQLKDYGIGDTDVLAGEVMTWGPEYETVADNLIKGAELIKTDTATQIKLDDQKDDIETFVNSNLLGVMPGNPKLRSLMIKGFKSIYAVTENKGEAFKQLMGNTVEYNGRTIQSDMGSWEFSFKLKDSLPEFWELPENRVQGLSPAQLKKSIIDGDLKFLGVGHNKTLLQFADGRVVKTADGKRDFEFVFPKDVATEWSKVRAYESPQQKEFKKQQAEKEKQDAIDKQNRMREIKRQEDARKRANQMLSGGPIDTRK